MVDLNSDLAEENEARPGVRVMALDAVLMLLGAAITIIGIVALLNLLQARTDSASARDKYEECTAAATELMEASDYLTTQARMCAVTGDMAYMQAYLDELLNVRRRDHAVSTLERYGNGEEAARELSDALAESNALADRELYAIRLVADSQNAEELPEKIQSVSILPADDALSAQEKKALAQEMLFDYEYNDLKSKIVQRVDECATDLVDELRSQREKSLEKERRLQAVLLAVLVLDAAFLAVAGASNYKLIMLPLRNYAQSIRNNEPLKIMGAQEIRNVAYSYNSLYTENLRRTMLLRHQAHTDSLTGLLNRGSFDKLLAHQGDDIALLIVDVDLFKSVNDTHGHEVGDEVLKMVGECLKSSFRTTDYACRIGGDEFAVILTEMGSEMRSVVSGKLDAIMGELADTNGGVPVVTLSVGIAFSATLPEGVNIYHAADKALYEAKHRGRNQYVFYEGE